MLAQPIIKDYEPLHGFNPQLKPQCWLVLYNNELVLSGKHVVWLTMPDFLSAEEGSKALVTGLWQGKPVGIVNLKRTAEANNLISIRSVLVDSNADMFALISHALQIAHSRAAHRFCGQCGAQNRPWVSQWAMHCDACNHSAYPRISPCIIVLVTKGEELLLVRHKRHGKQAAMHTVIAGFIEPGETAEAAVHREVMEEAGVKLSSASYQLSQSWPFPHSLMLGFHAEYAHGEIRLDETELCAGGWFSPSDLPDLPPEFTISRQLIERFLAKI